MGRTRPFVVRHRCSDCFVESGEKVAVIYSSNISRLGFDYRLACGSVNSVRPRDLALETRDIISVGQSVQAGHDIDSRDLLNNPWASRADV
jgi:hypothetical protein